MNVEKFNANKDEKLSKFLMSKGFDYNGIKKILRKKDIKVNGKRVSEDILLKQNDEVVCFFENKNGLLEIVYEDENIVVVLKPRMIETVSKDENQETLNFKLSHQIGTPCFAVHRLDRNTQGLVVFAKNIEAKVELEKAFKNRTIGKFYLALVFGKIEKKEETLVAYLKKNQKDSVVLISDNLKQGYEKIITKYKVLENFENTSLLEIELVTGKTHQIRAHFAHIGHFVIGDQKYGDKEVNKKFKKHFQCLTAFKIIFHFEKDEILFYLNNKTIELPISKIDFLSKNK